MSPKQSSFAPRTSSVLVGAAPRLEPKSGVMEKFGNKLAALFEWILPFAKGNNAAIVGALQLGFAVTVAVLALAWALTRVAHSVWGNIPMAAVLVIVGRPLFDRRRVIFPQGALRPQTPAGHVPFKTCATPAPSRNGPNKKRATSPAVLQAWEQLSQRIVKEFVQDLWYGGLTEDLEGPLEIQRILDAVFAELVRRAQHVDLADLLLREAVDLACEQLHLHRTVRASLGATFVANCTAGALERAVLAELSVDSVLHPALRSLPGSRTQALRALMDGFVSHALPHPDRSNKLLKVVARELCCACVMEPLLGLFKPGTVNRLLFTMLKDAEPEADTRAADVAPPSREAVATPDAPTLPTPQPQPQTPAAQTHQPPEPEPAAELAGAGMRPPPPSREAAKVAAARSVKGAASGGAASLAGGMPKRQRYLIQQETLRLELHSQVRANDASGSDSRIHPDADGAGEGRPSARPAPCPVSGAFLGGSSSAVDVRVLGGVDKRDASAADAADASAAGGSKKASLEFASVGATHGSDAARLSRSLSADSLATRSPPPPLSSSPLMHRSGPRTRQPWEGAPDVAQREGQAHAIHRTHSKLMTNIRAKVIDAEVAAEGHVAYHIAVWDGYSPAWTVHRRFCNFELLHGRVKDLQERKVRLPPKRVLFHTLTEDFVQQRRHQLNRYLQALLADKNVAECQELWEFLSEESALYGNQPARTKLGHTTAARSDLSLMTRLWEDVDIFNQRRKLEKARKPGQLGKAASDTGRVSVDSEPAATPRPLSQDQGPRTCPQDPLVACDLSSSAAVHEPPSSVDVSLGASPDSSRGVPEPLIWTTPATSTPSSPLDSVPPAAVEMLPMNQSTSPDARGKEDRVRQQPWEVAGRTAELVLRTTGAQRASGGSPDERGSPPPPIPEEEGEGEEDRQSSDGDHQPQTMTPSPAKSTPLMDGYELQKLSAPLYELVDTIFQLQSRGWLRRNVIAMARQIVDTWAGDAIDDLLASKLRTLSQSGTVAGLISGLHSALWPGNVFISKAAQATDEVRPEDVKALLLMRTKHPALVNLIGSKCFKEGVKDVFELIQSEVFMQQIGMKVIEACLLAWFPELQPIVQEVRTSTLKE